MAHLLTKTDRFGVILKPFPVAVDFSALFIRAALKRNLAVVEYLLATIAKQNIDINMVKDAVGDNLLYNILSYSVTTSDLDPDDTILLKIMQALVDRGIDIDAQNFMSTAETSLKRTAFLGRDRLVEFLIHKGADLSLKPCDGRVVSPFYEVLSNCGRNTVNIAIAILQHAIKDASPRKDKYIKMLQEKGAQFIKSCEKRGFDDEAKSLLDLMQENASS